MNELILLQDLGMRYPTNISTKKARYGLYKCVCGKEFETQIQSVKSGKTKSCNCLQKQITANRNILNATHKQTKHRLYNTWKMMIQRCNNPKNKAYSNYGERGIKVCDEWNDVENFIRDMYPSYIDGLTIDRINPNGNYEKDNCRWATKTTQARNTRKLQSNNNSGYRGVCFHKQIKKWISQITVDKKHIHLGSFDNALDGAKAYDNYITEHNLQHTKNF